MFRFFYALFAFSVANLSVAQPLSSSVTNHLRAGDGTRHELTGPQRLSYFENWTDVRLYAPSVTVGFRLEHTQPPEFGTPVTGFTKVFVEAEKSGISLRAGDLYDLFGNGLTLNLVENRALAFDTGLRGVRLRYASDIVSVTALGGRILYRDYLTLGRSNPLAADYDVRAVSASVAPHEVVTIGAGLVYSERELSMVVVPSAAKARSRFPSINAVIRLPLVEATLERAWRSQDKVAGTPGVEGFATYAALSHSGDGYGITLEYKDYAFEQLDPSRKAVLTRATLVPPFVLGPTGVKEHTFILPGRYAHRLDYGDETGVQAEIVLVPIDDLTVTLNGSLASRRSGWLVDLSTLTLSKKNVGIPWLPSVASERSPFREAFAEAEYFAGSTTNRLKGALHYRKETAYNVYDPALTTSRQIMTFPLAVEWELRNDLVGRLEFEAQFVKDTYVVAKPTFSNTLAGLSLTMFGWLGAGVRYEWTDSIEDPSGRKDWTVVEATARVGESHIVTFSSGAERGGQVCSGGICRILEPFNGLRMSVTSNF